METGKDVWVVIEHSDGEIKPVSFEILYIRVLRAGTRGEGGAPARYGSVGHNRGPLWFRGLSGSPRKAYMSCPAEYIKWSNSCWNNGLAKWS